MDIICEHFASVAVNNSLNSDIVHHSSFDDSNSVRKSIVFLIIPDLHDYISLNSVVILTVHPRMSCTLTNKIKTICFVFFPLLPANVYRIMTISHLLPFF